MDDDALFGIYLGIVAGIIMLFSILWGVGLI